MAVTPLGSPEALAVNGYEQLEVNEAIISVMDCPSVIAWSAFPDVIDPETVHTGLTIIEPLTDEDTADPLLLFSNDTL